MSEYTNEELAKMAEEREAAEKAGVFSHEPLTCEQEAALAYAMSTISSLCKETNSSLSDLVKLSGYSL